MTATNGHKLSDFKVLVFDFYGTLADWESGIYTALKPLLSLPAASHWTRQEALLAFFSVETDLSVQHPQMPYADLLAKAHEVFEARLRAASNLPEVVKEDGTITSTTTSPQADDPHVVFGASIRDWPLFPDTAGALQALSQHYKLVVLTNIDRASFEKSHARLSPSPFTLTLTPLETHAFKPSTLPHTHALACIRDDPALLNAPKEQVLVVAQSLYHDHVPARTLGLTSVWIDREGAFVGNQEVTGNRHWTWRFRTLNEMAEAVKAEVGGTAQL